MSAAEGVGDCVWEVRVRQGLEMTRISIRGQ